MYSHIYINLRNLPKININKIISKELKDLYTNKRKKNIIIINKKNIKNDINYRTSPW